MFASFTGEKAHKKQLSDSPYRLSPKSSIYCSTGVARVIINHKLRLVIWSRFLLSYSLSCSYWSQWPFCALSACHWGRKRTFSAFKNNLEGVFSEMCFTQPGWCILLKNAGWVVLAVGADTAPPATDSSRKKASVLSLLSCQEWDADISGQSSRTEKQAKNAWLLHSSEMCCRDLKMQNISEVPEL